MPAQEPPEAREKLSDDRNDLLLDDVAHGGVSLWPLVDHSASHVSDRGPRSGESAASPGARPPPVGAAGGASAVGELGRLAVPGCVAAIGACVPGGT